MFIFPSIFQFFSAGEILSVWLSPVNHSDSRVYLFSLHRESRKVKTSVALRKLFPRPSFLPDKIEIGLEKHVLIDSPDTPTYELVSKL